MEDKSPEEIFDQLLESARHKSNHILPNCDGLASLNIIHLRYKLESTNISIIDNENINYECLDKKGLHILSKGMTRLPMNFIGVYRIKYCVLALDLPNPLC